MLKVSASTLHADVRCSKLQKTGVEGRSGEGRFLESAPHVIQVSPKRVYGTPTASIALEEASTPILKLSISLPPSSSAARSQEAQQQEESFRQEDARGDDKKDGGRSLLNEEMEVKAEMANLLGAISDTIEQEDEEEAWLFKTKRRQRAGLGQTSLVLGIQPPDVIWDQPGRLPSHKNFVVLPYVFPYWL